MACLFIVIKCMELATTTKFFLDLATSNRAPTIIQYYRKAGTSLIQHIYAILAFKSGSYGTPNTPEFKLEYSCKCKSQAVFDS